jgi:hypothetical protein
VIWLDLMDYWLKELDTAIEAALYAAWHASEPEQQ